MSESPMPGSSAGLDTWPGGGLRTVSPCSHADHTVDSVNRELCSIFSDISKKITPLRKIGRKKKKKKGRPDLGKGTFEAAGIECHCERQTHAIVKH